MCKVKVSRVQDLKKNVQDEKKNMHDIEIT